MDELVSAAEANRHFSRILREVREGRSFVVTSHSMPVARIVPAAPGDPLAAAARASLLARLAQAPVTILGEPWRRDDLYDE